MQIIVLDQDKDRAEAICTALRAVGHYCESAGSPHLVLAQLGDEDIDLLIIDGETSGDFGTPLICAARQASPDLPILLATHRTSHDEILAALDAGASDYIVKPVRHGEIVTRVQVLLKRAYPEHRVGELLRFGRYGFETGLARITLDDKAVEVTQKEFDLALLFFRNLGRPLSRAYVREVIWPGESELPSRTLDTHVSRVRSKLSLRPENGFRLSPVYSYGYRLEQLPE